MESKVLTLGDKSPLCLDELVYVYLSSIPSLTPQLGFQGYELGWN